MNRRERRKQAKLGSGAGTRPPEPPREDAAALDREGVALARQGRLAEAAVLLARAGALDPDDAGFRNNLGNVLSSLGRREEALACFEQAVALRPGDAALLANLGSALYRLGRLAESERAYRRAFALRPDYPEALSNFGNVLFDLERIEESVAANRRAVALKPDYAPAWNNLGNGLKRLGRYADAVGAYERAHVLAPDYADALANLGETLKEQGRAAEAVAVLRRAVAGAPGRAAIGSNFLFAMNADGGLAPDDVFAAHREWGRRVAAAAPPAGRHDNSRDPDRRLRVGYLSPDFRRHSVAYFFEPLLAAHDRRAIEVICYSNVARPDAVTERLKGLADGWREGRALDDADLAASIRRDAIDVLVDLAGHTMDSRLAVLAHRPAPVQASYLGYPNTTGLAAVDLRLTDASCDPLGDADRFHVEKLVRLPRVFLAYRPPDDAPETAPPPCLANGFVTFGSFNNLAKVGPETVAAWAAVLGAVPDARLFLKAKALACEGTRARVAAAFGREGVAPARLEFSGWIVDGNPLSAYRRVDVALDTFPYNGTTTTCEALWMGVPVATVAGRTHAGRVGLSLLSAAGLGELAFADAPALVAGAAALAHDRDRLLVLRRTLRARLAASPLLDGPGLARAIEAAYRAAWGDWCAAPVSR